MRNDLDISIQHQLSCIFSCWEGLVLCIKIVSPDTLYTAHKHSGIAICAMHNFPNKVVKIASVRSRVLHATH